MSRSLCALQGVLLCFLAARPGLAQDTPVRVCGLDSGCLCVLELLSYVSKALVADDTQNEARRLFHRAESLQRAGKLEEARIAYQNVHLISPTSIYGQKAMERIHAIETMFRNFSHSRSPLDFTIQLGTVDDHF